MTRESGEAQNGHFMVLLRTIFGSKGERKLILMVVMRARADAENGSQSERPSSLTLQCYYISLLTDQVHKMW